MEKKASDEQMPYEGTENAEWTEPFTITVKNPTPFTVIEGIVLPEKKESE